MSTLNEPLGLVALATIGLLAWVLLLAYQQNADLTSKLAEQQADAQRTQARVCQIMQNKQVHEFTCTMINRQLASVDDGY